MPAPAPFESSYTDPARLCPVPAGPALLDGTCWTVRLPQSDARIEAPAALLRRVATACDGTRPVLDIVAATRPAALRAKVQALLHDLLSAGVLVDAALYTVAAQRFAWTPPAIGLRAEKPVWQQVRHRFGPAAHDGGTLGPAVASPLDALLDRRRSVRTFDDRAVDETSLRSYLWLLGGITAIEPAGAEARPLPRRTVPSAGATHAIRPYVVLQRPVGPWGPGAYEVQYPAARRVQLRPVGPQQPGPAWLPRAVLHPGMLRFAAGMVFLVADPRLGAIKYLARSLQFLFIEAGAALQNAALAAPALGLAMSAYGGYVEPVAAEGLGLGPDDVVLASAIFGPPPTEQQTRLAAAAAPVEFEWKPSSGPHYTLPFHHGRVRTWPLPATGPDGWGRSADPWLAYIKATVEACERRAMGTPRAVQVARRADWEDALDPRSVIRYRPEQFRQRGTDLRPFDDHLPCGWVTGQRLATGRPVQVLAEQVYLPAPLGETFPGSLAGYVRCSSSGCAGHTALGPARDAAILELVERDAFMRAWLTQQPGVGISLRSLPGDLARRAKALQQAGCTLALQVLASPWAVVVMACAQHHGCHFTAVSAAARMTLRETLGSAMEEMEAIVFARLHEPETARLLPRDVRNPRDHGALYATARHYRRADAFLLAPSTPRTFATLERADARPTDTTLQRLLDAGLDVVMVDITAPHSAIDDGRTAVTVVRALVPGLVPISFGYGREPLGCLEQVDRRGRFPHPFA
jgi:ribosomal protein S12 methylthiotransferase accessory factor